jgi:hypothetical protein
MGPHHCTVTLTDEPKMGVLLVMQQINNAVFSVEENFLIPFESAAGN